jgi:ABC-2 type transport system ATP-binding protein
MKMSVDIGKISKFYGSQKALDDISFSISKGEMLGLLGPNGAGKSTLMKIIAGFIQASSGTVLINGNKVNVDSIELKKNVGYLPENNPLYTDLYITEYLDIVAGFYKLHNRDKRVWEMIGITGLEKEKHKKIGALSKGYRQRVGLAQALIHDPSVLILDEPTSGLDPNQLVQIRSLISEISKEKTVVLSSHILHEIEAICKRIVIINQGKLVADSRIEEIGNLDKRVGQKVFVSFDKEVTGEKLLTISGVNFCEKSDGGHLLSSNSPTDIRPEIFRFAVSNDLVILAMVEKQQNLEEVFHSLTR